jgi:hypothetical protein
MYVNASVPASYGGSGVLWNDLTVNANNATLFNGVAWDGQAMVFNGTNQFASAADSASLDITGALTMTFWIKSSASTNGGIISKSSDAAKYFAASAQKSYEVGRFGNQLYFQISNGTTTNLIALTIAETAAIYSGNWHEVTFTFAGAATTNGMKVYVDGVLIRQANTTISSIQNLASTFNIGGGGAYFTNGRIGAVVLNNTALDAAQVLSNYNAIKPYFP